VQKLNRSLKQLSGEESLEVIEAERQPKRFQGVETFDEIHMMPSA
jgi:hypothetical protein